ncbi:Cyclic di-GMP phosphodiesterase response regulator RpfG [subsurface metagenome]
MEYSTCIGEELGLSDDEIQRLKLAAILHDVGKIGIPDYVLLKKGKLTDEEFETIKKHPDYGDDIVRNVKQLQHMIPGIRHHHERYDGSGYPDGLEGNEADIVARIIAVADAFDAMTSDRPYRKSLNQLLALEELKKYRGTQFDPDAVKAFMKVYRNQPTLFEETSNAENTDS